MVGWCDGAGLTSSAGASYNFHNSTARAFCACSSADGVVWTFLLSSILSPMVLGKLPVPGRPTIWITVGQGPIALAVGAGGGCLDIFTLVYPFFPLSPSLWETARYRLKYCLKGPLNPKTTNQPTLWETGGGQVVRMCWVNFQCRGVLQL